MAVCFSYMRPAAAIMAKSIMLADEVMWEPALSSSPSPDSSGASEEVGVCTILSVHVQEEHNQEERDIRLWRRW